MTEPNQGSPAPQAGNANPGSPAPQAGQGGGPDPRGPQAPTTPAPPPVDDRERLDGAHRKGYREAREQLFRDLGMDWDPATGRAGYQAAISQLRDRLGPAAARAPQADDEDEDDQGKPPGQGEAQYERLARDLQKEAAKLRRELSEAKRRDELHAARDLAALRVEVRGLLREAGFVAEALDDAVDLVCPDPHAPRLFVGRGPDGVTPTLLERLADGETRPARQGLEEWLAEQAKSRPWFVAGKVARGPGGGPAGTDEPAPFDPWTDSEPYSYEKRRAEIRARGRGAR